MMTRAIAITLALGALLGAELQAQEKLNATIPQPDYRAGWTFTPTIGVTEIYDDNVSLFGRSRPEEQNQDYVTTVFPAVDLHYSGKHTFLDMGYSGSFLNYRTFSELDRWDQSARFELRRQESARMKWFARASAAVLPTTDLVELGGIPYRHNGTRTADGRVGFDYAFSARDSLTSSANYQVVDFDKPDSFDTPDPFGLVLHGGQVAEWMNAYRHQFSSRMAVGADYSFRRALVSGDPEPFNIHTTEAALDYELSPSWTFSGGAGIVFLQENASASASTGPAYRGSLNHRRGLSRFHIGYMRSYIPSFGYGGTIQNQEAGLGYHTPIFGSRRFYVDLSAVFRDDHPLTNTREQLPLRSLRAYSSVGWSPQPWVRLEAFYTRVQQSSLQAGGQVDRNQVGFQIVTSKPMRMQ